MLITKLDVTKLEKAIDSFENAIKASEDIEKSSEKYIKDTIRAGLIQNFEFTYELSWKFMQRYLEMNNQIDKTIPKKQLFREAFENGLIEDPETWFKYHEARNKTSHMYSEESSGIVYALSKDFINDVNALLNNLRRINEQ